MLLRRRFLSLAGAALAVPFASRVAAAQGYPARPVRVIVPYAPGGLTDVFGRLIAQKLSEHLGKQQFYVENIGGANGNIGMGRAAKTAPDGHTILVVSTSYVINPALYDNIPYDAAKDFDPVNIAVVNPLVLTVHPSLPARTVNELVALIKANPGKYSYATGGRLAAASGGRAVPPGARPRPRARAVQQRGPGDRLGGRRPYADLRRLAGAGRPADPGRQAPRAGDHQQDALADPAGRADHGGGGLSGGRGENCSRCWSRPARPETSSRCSIARWCGWWRCRS